jgi:RNA polymerase sigma factor (sigma-70 family)
MMDDSDSGLLGRFVEQQDQAAFSALVERHAPIVLGICRRVLGDHHDAEDAAQASFIVLAKTARRLDRRPPLGPWLHRVAYNLARNALRDRRGRERVKKEATAMPHRDARPDGFHAEIDKALVTLPERERIAITLFHLEGRTVAEVAQAVGRPVSTIYRWLSTGRERLRQSIVLRGVSVTAVVLVSGLGSLGTAAVPVDFAATTTAAVMMSGAGTATPAALLASQGIKAMKILHGVKAALLAASLVAAIGTVGWVGFAMRGGFAGTDLHWSAMPSGIGSWSDAEGDLFSGGNAGSGVARMIAWPAQRLLVASVIDHGLWSSMDAGAHWQRLGEAGRRPADAGQIVQFVLDPAEPRRMWCTGIYGFAGWRTDDGGKTFVRLGDQTHLEGIGIDLTDAQRRTVLVGLHQQPRSLRLSTDGGLSFRLIGDRLPEGSGFSSLPVVVDSTTFITNTSGYGDRAWGIWRTTDSGQNWTKVSDTGPADCALITHTGTIIYSLLWARDEIVSRDHGQTWTKLGGPVRGLLTELEDGSIIGLSDSEHQQPYRSADDGRTWAAFGPQLPWKTAAKPSAIIYDPIQHTFVCYQEKGRVMRWSPGR